MSSADLEVTKTASAGQADVGSALQYTIVITNNGPSTATNVTVTDPLPPNFSLSSATPTQGSCSGTTTVTCTLGTLINGATATIVIQGTVTAEGNLSNTATVVATESDPDPDNNQSTVSVSTSASIPTASEWGLILMALMLAVAGVVMKK